MNRVLVFVVFVVCNSVLQGKEVAKSVMDEGCDGSEVAGTTFLQAESYSADRSLLRIAAGYSSDPLSFDPLVVYYDDRATLSYDGSYDALKLFNTDKNVTNFFVFSQEGSKLSISGVPVAGSEQQNFRLGLRTEKNGTVVVRASSTEGLFNDRNIVLLDEVTGTETRLSAESDYSVSLAAGEYYDRFFLSVSTLVMEVPRQADDAGAFKVYYSGGVLRSQVVIPEEGKGNLEIYNMSGQLLYCYRITSPGLSEFYPDLVRGNYIIRVYSPSMSISRKIFINPD